MGWFCVLISCLKLLLYAGNINIKYLLCPPIKDDIVLTFTAAHFLPYFITAPFQTVQISGQDVWCG